MQNKKVLITAGGTGGHLFPAQAFAKQLLEDHDVDVLFSAAGLGNNRYFKKEMFAYKEITSATVFKKNALQLLKALFYLTKGVFESFKVIKEYKPDVVVGFGSFHSFPILCAALLKNIPIVLFEPNSVAGRVNRLFSRWAKVSAIQFAMAKERLRGTTIEVKVPLWQNEARTTASREDASSYFNLKADKLTFLVFGGSQGASFINKLFCEAVCKLSQNDFQVVHVVGKKDLPHSFREAYDRLGIKACVKEFEENMHFAWTLADLAVCRSGAATLSEAIAYTVPQVLIPYPFAVDDHQKKNGEFMVEIKAAKMFLESQLDADKLAETVRHFLDDDKKVLKEMRSSLVQFKNKESKKDLSSLVCEILKGQ